MARRPRRRPRAWPRLDLLRGLALASPVSPTLAIVLPRLSGVSVDMTLAGYVVVFFFLAAAACGRVIADLGFLMEISPDDRRPGDTEYRNVLVAPSRLLPLIAGSLASVWSFQALFAVAAVAVRVQLAVRTGLEAASRAVEVR